MILRPTFVDLFFVKVTVAKITEKLSGREGDMRINKFIMVFCMCVGKVVASGIENCERNGDLHNLIRSDFNGEMLKVETDGIDFSAFRTSFRLPPKYNISFSVHHGLSFSAKLNAFENGYGLGFIELRKFNLSIVNDFELHNKDLATKNVNDIWIVSGKQVLDCERIFYSLLVYDKDQIMAVSDENKMLVDYIEKRIFDESNKRYLRRQNN